MHTSGDYLYTILLLFICAFRHAREEATASGSFPSTFMVEKSSLMYSTFQISNPTYPLNDATKPNTKQQLKYSLLPCRM